MSAPAACTEGSMPHLSHVVARPEGHGWVRRTPDPTDGRGTLAALTDHGWATVVATAPGHVARLRALVLAPLDPALVRRLAETHRRVMGASDPHDGCFRRRPGSTTGSRRREGPTMSEDRAVEHAYGDTVAVDGISAVVRPGVLTSR